jgi:hypothetical protein
VEPLFNNEFYRLVDSSVHPDITKTALSIWGTEIRLSPRSKAGLCRMGFEESLEEHIKGGRVPDVLSLCKITPPEGKSFEGDAVEQEGTGIVIHAVSMMFRSPWLRQAELQFLVPTVVRKEGYGKFILALSLYWAFTNRDINCVYCRVPIVNTPAVKVCNQYMNCVGSMPSDWLWFGQQVPTNLYALTTEDLLYDRFDEMTKKLKEFRVEGLELMTFDEFKSLHGKE